MYSVTESNVLMQKGTSAVTLGMENLVLNGIGDRHECDFYGFLVNVLAKQCKISLFLPQ